MADDPIVDSLNPMPKRDNDRDERVRNRAFALWEQAGRPEGHELDHWFAAESETDSDDTASLGVPLDPGAAIPTARSTEAPGLEADRPYDTDDDQGGAPAAPKTAGAPQPGPDTSRSPVANRNPAGPRKAGATPRPTNKPIVGGR